MQHRLIMLDPYIEHCIALILTSYSWSADFFMIRLVYLLAYDIGCLCLVHAFLIEGTYVSLILVTRPKLHFHGQLTLLKLCQMFVIWLVSPLQCSLFGPYIGEIRYICILMVSWFNLLSDNISKGRRDIGRCLQFMYAILKPAGCYINLIF